MNKGKMIKILEKEVTRLNELLKQSPAMEFERLKEQMEQELAETKEYKARYHALMDEVKVLKDELEEKVKNSIEKNKEG